MPVTDRQLAALRALLVRDTNEYRRLFGQLDGEGEQQGFLVLGTGAFFEAVRSRFRGKKRSDIVQWIADARTQRDPNGQIDPNVAEKLILWVFGKASVEDLDVKVGDRHQAMLLALLVEDEAFDLAGLNAFLEKARDFANASNARRDTGG